MKNLLRQKVFKYYLKNIFACSLTGLFPGMAASSKTLKNLKKLV